MDDAPASLLVLAGGGSRRMGRPKALLPVAGGTLLEYVAARLAPGFAELLVSLPLDLEMPPALASRGRAVRDRYPGAGPLAGIEAGLAVATTAVVLVVACDMPYVSRPTAQRLVAAATGHDAAVPVAGDRPEPVFAAYARSAAGPISAGLDAGSYRARDVLGELDVSFLTDVDPLELRSLNTPEDYAAFLDALR